MGRALLLVNMGGPSSEAQVRPYLRAIFRDRFILPAPSFIRFFLAELIAARRAGKSAERYRLIGGASPLPRWTVLLREQVARVLDEERSGISALYAFRYTEPRIDQAAAALRAAMVKEALLLPLFPHYTEAMTGSVIAEARRAGPELFKESGIIRSWWSHPAILALGRDYLDAALARAGDDFRLLFIAHGIPQRSVDRGEDYPQQVRAHAEALAQALPLGSWSLAFQSRLGPVKWTRPYLEEEMDRLAGSAKTLILFPLSFAADCLETLFDLDLEAASRAKEKGFGSVIRVPAFNDDPRFAKALVRVVLEREDV